MKAAAAHPGRHFAPLSRGLTLIEVLAALVVMSIGLIGLAALHMTSLKTAHSAHYRSVATVIAIDAEERLWLELADTPPEQAPDIVAVRAEWQEHWGASGVRMPGLTMDLVEEDPDQSADWTDYRITVAWTESRLEDVEEGLEALAYRARILKRPDPLPLN